MINKKNNTTEILQSIPTTLTVGKGEVRSIITHDLHSCDFTIEEGAELSLIAIIKKGMDLPVNITVNLERHARVRFTVRGVLEGEEKTNVTIRSNHNGPATNALYGVRVVVKDNAIFECEGIIVVPQSGVEANARYEQHILNASKKAHIKTMPSLEIEPSQVTISHAASVESWDDEVLFYSESRGMDNVEAKEMISEGFLEKGLEYIKDTEDDVLVKNMLISDAKMLIETKGV